MRDVLLGVYFLATVTASLVAGVTTSLETEFDRKVINLCPSCEKGLTKFLMIEEGE